MMDLYYLETRPELAFNLLAELLSSPKMPIYNWEKYKKSVQLQIEKKIKPLPQIIYNRKFV